MSMEYYAPRTCHEFVKDDAGQDVQKTDDLSSYRDCPAYVLLGKPGIGKTTSFKQEATQPNCQYITARDFITLPTNPDWKNKTLFIDGLDEVRAGKDDVLSPFEKIRKKLGQLARPKFRISCREADWYGKNDRQELEKVSPDPKIKEIFLIELSEGDLKVILIKNHHKTEAAAFSFLQEAQRRGLIELIKNPQILEMLVAAVGEENDWPRRKSGIFKLACEKLLLEEWNPTHSIANRKQSPPSEELMQASGMLCAVMLLARKHGFALLQSDAGDNFPFIADMATEHAEHLGSVSRTRLFTTHEGHSEYSHRIFAEYLSAYYLSNKVITGGLPIGRLLALMTGNDGGVVTELRGVYAWLVTLCHTERDFLMKRDPFGVVLYGDVSLFSKEDRLKLLHTLSLYAETKADSGIDYRNTQPFGAFCQDDIGPNFRAILETTDNSERHQFLIEYVLLSMTHGKVLPGLSATLVGMLHKHHIRPCNRKQILEVLFGFNNVEVLQKLLDDIHNNVIIDRDDELMGMLLARLYPVHITPDRILKYLHPPKSQNFTGCYSDFWGYYLDKKANDAQVAELLDNFVTHQVAQNPGLEEIIHSNTIGRLLVRGIEKFGDIIEIDKLSDWLVLGLDEYDSIRLSGHEGITEISDWLSEHPEIQKKLIEYHLQKTGDNENSNSYTMQITEWLFFAKPPDDYGLWCLEIARTTENETIGNHFFIRSLETLMGGSGSAGMSLEVIEDAAEKDIRVKRYWKKYRVSEIPNDSSRYMLNRNRRREKREQNKQAFLHYIKNNLGDIEEGKANPGIFYDVGRIYYGRLVDSTGDTPRERLTFFFENDLKSVHSILNGLRRFLDRDDIPTASQIFQLFMENKSHRHFLPYLAAVNELDVQKIPQLAGDQIEKALAFYYVDGKNKEPEWYKFLLRDQSKLVTRIYVEFVRTALQAGMRHMVATRPLAYDENYASVARLATLPLLESIPTRCTNEELSLLNDLLTAAIQHTKQSLLIELIEKKLLLRSMNVAQRVYWLATGFILDSNQFGKRLIEFISRKEPHINYFSEFLTLGRYEWSPLNKLSLSGSVSLIKLLGSNYSPYTIPHNGYMRGSFDSSEIISKSISRLATFPTAEATEAIESLLKSEQLTKWHSLLKQALHKQRIRKREAMFQHSSLEQIREALKNGSPANVADLACITRESVRKLANQIKYGNTNDFRQYWLHDKNKHLQERQHEDTCRDRFLSDLKPLLHEFNVDAESRYAVERRADIRVSFGGSVGFNVPIEIKCNDSRDLWHGLRNQLIESYTTDPGAGGYGIYLVFWFGYDKTTPHPESGPKPKTPSELEERLNQLLKDDAERKKISVCVIDCTPP